MSGAALGAIINHKNRCKGALIGAAGHTDSVGTDADNYTEACHALNRRVELWILPVMAN